jgi:membrane-bound serine protease (ClpP class)
MHRLMLTLGFLLQIWGLGAAPASETRQSPPSAIGARKVYVIPVREEIGTALVFLIRRGVKQAIEDKAELLVLDMETNGGRVDKTEEIIQILNQFQGRTMTYVNRKAFSAGAFISFATQQIYMAPEAVIGAAAPIMVGAGGGAEKVSEAAEAKMISATAALVRASAEKNGHNVDVAEAMIRRTKELVIEGEVLNRPGELLTLTSRGAEKRYGASSKPLLSSGTYPSLADLLIGTGYGSAERVVVEPTGWEQVGSFLSSQMVSSLLLAIGVIGVYLEFKAPGFGLPGIVGGSAFALYFLGGYLAGLSGAGWVVVFFLGLALLVVEFFFFPGTLVVGLVGAGLMVLAVVMAMVDAYPRPDGLLPVFPQGDVLLRPLNTLLLSTLVTVVGVLALARFLPQTALYRAAGSPVGSGMQTEELLAQRRAQLLGREGVTLTALRPGGKVLLGDDLCDALSRGEMIDKGERIKVVGFSGVEVTVERVV